jgi:hypothetical protein
MQKLFLKAVFFIVGLSLILKPLGTLAERVAPLEDWRMEYEQAEANLNARNEQIEAITLGNSHAGAVDYSVLGVDGQSMAFAAADLFEIEKIVVSLDHKLPNLNTAFITISPYSFSRDNGKFESLRSRRVSFYSIFPVWSPIEGDLSNFLMGKVDSYTRIMDVVRSDSWKGVWPRLLASTPPPDPYPYDGIHTTSVWGDCFHYTAKQLDDHAWEIAGRNVSSSVQMANAHPNLEQDAFNALSSTIERLQSRGVRVILLTPVYYEKYNMYFVELGSQIAENKRQMIDRLQQIYKVENYDFSNDPLLSAHPELFYNSDHLSECGNRVFTEKLLEAMTVDEPIYP